MKTEAEYAKDARLDYCRKLLDLFARGHGRQPRTMVEMDAWLEAEIEAGRLPGRDDIDRVLSN